MKDVAVGHLAGAQAPATARSAVIRKIETGTECAATTYRLPQSSCRRPFLLMPASNFSCSLQSSSRQPPCSKLLEQFLGTLDIRSQVLEERVDDPQHLMRQRYYGSIPEQSSTSTYLSHWLPLPDLTPFGRFPADSLTPGQTPAHEQNFSQDVKLERPGPISAKISRAEISLRWGMLIRRSMHS